MRQQHYRVVLDTNVWLSALIFGGKPRQVVELFAHRRIDVVVSEEMFTEMRRKVSSKFPDFASEAAALEIMVREAADIVQLGEITVTVCRDPADNYVLETAIVGGCDYIISGDKDLLSLGKYHDTAILPPAKFLDVFSVEVPLQH